MRARVLQFGRGVSEGAVLSLSLTAHPVTGCVLVVAKSAPAIRGSTLGSPALPFGPVTKDSSSGVSSESSGKRHASDHSPPLVDSGTTSGAYVEACGSPLNFANQAATDGSPRSSVATVDGQGVSSDHHRGTDNSHSATSDVSTDVLAQFETRDSSEDDIGTVMTECLRSQIPLPLSGICSLSGGNCPLFSRPLLYINGVSTTLCAALQATSEEPPQRPAIRGHSSEATGVVEPLNGRQQTGGQDAGTLSGRGHAEQMESQGSPDEHSTWWFCPCEEDPSFYFPVAECLSGEMKKNMF